MAKQTSAATLAMAVLVSLIISVGIGGYFKVPAVEKPKEAAVSGPDINSPYLNVNGVTSWYASSGLNQASTTVCSLKSPAATSTLVVASIQFTTGSSSSVIIELAKDNTYAASSTLIGTTYILAAGQDTIIASTSPTIGMNVLRFAPNQYFNVKYGGVNGALNTFVGTCKAEWRQN